MIVVPITTSLLQGKRGPTVVEIPVGSEPAGLPQATNFAICHQITTVDRAKLAKRIVALPPECLRKVERVWRALWTWSEIQ
jgi:mRNA interferase MazF